MFRINRAAVENEADKANSKTEKVRVNNTVFDAVKMSFANLIDTIADLATYNAAHWVNNIDRWHQNLSSQNTKTYKRGEIVFLDLGAQNFKSEPSYTHACIVLANRKTSILIVPCSTKKYGTGYRDIIDATPADGFLKNTGIQSESFRWVNKNRVVSQTGNQVSPTILDQLDQVMLSFTPSIEKELKQKDILIAQLQERISQLESKEEIESSSEDTPGSTAETPC